jgi:cyclophilin family peptidyl-prolyl cis-trans isomerase
MIPRDRFRARRDVRSAVPILLCLTLLASCGPRIAPEEWVRVHDLADRRVAAESAWRPLLDHVSPRVRAEAAAGMGRVGAPELAPMLLDALEDEPAPGARRAMILALGRSGSDDAARALEEVLETGTDEEKAAAARAVGQLGNTFAMPLLLKALESGNADVRGEALLAIPRLIGRRATPTQPLPPALEQPVRAALAARLDDGPEVRWRAAYALSEVQLRGGARALTDALDDDDPRVLLFALRGLARWSFDAAANDPRLVAHLAHPSPHVAAAAAAALGELRVSSALEPLREALLRRGTPGDAHVRATALSAVATLSPDEAPTVDALLAATGDPTHLVRREAWMLLAEIAPDVAREPLTAALSSGSPYDRAEALRATSRIAESWAREAIVAALDDPVPAVRAAALEALADRPGADADDVRERALAALGADDLAIVATAASVLADAGAAEDLEALRAAHRRMDGRARVEARAQIEAAVRTLAGDAAADALAARDGGAATEGSTVALDAEDLAKPPTARVRLVTTKGALEVELYRDEAPRHVESFLERARAGEHDGLPIHRVVTGFVVQGLDPRGDGWGTDGVVLHDEIGTRRFVRGSLGMPNSGRDTGGCQVFVTHVPTPHLDGRYTLFGRVTSGLDVLDALDVGDVVESVAIADS